jgi:hypothetical protein
MSTSAIELEQPGPVASEDAPRDTHTRDIWLGYIVGLFVTAGLLVSIAPYGVPTLHMFLGLVVLAAGALPTAVHLARRRPELPVFPMIMLVYGAGYGLPVFTTEPEFWVAGANVMSVPEDRFVTEALLLSLLGIAMLQVGFHLLQNARAREKVPLARLELDPGRAQVLVSMLGLAGLMLSWAIDTGRFVPPAQFAAIVSVLHMQVFLAVALLYSYYLQGKLPRWGVYVLLAILGGETLIGLSSGNISRMMFPWMVVAAVFWRVRRRFPTRYVLGGLLFFVLLQPVKQEWRYWAWLQGHHEGNALERVKLWGEISVQTWGNILSGGQTSVEYATRGAAVRGNYLHLFAHSVSYTPAVVPYWQGSTYSYLKVAFIPRFLWPEKPAAQDANNDFALAYHLLPWELIGRTVVGLPHLVEAFINFGIPGVFLIMGLIGAVYGLLDRILNHRGAGEGGAAVYAVLLVGLLSIESATTGTFGGVVQNGVVYFGILWFARA